MTRPPLPDDTDLCCQIEDQHFAFHVDPGYPDTREEPGQPPFMDTLYALILGEWVYLETVSTDLESRIIEATPGL